MNRHIALVCTFIVLGGWGWAFPAWSDAAGGATSEKRSSEHRSVGDADDGPKSARSPRIEAGIRMLLVFPTAPDPIPFSESELTLFRSSLGKSDQMGIVVADRKNQVLSLDGDAQVTVSSARVLDGLKRRAVGKDGAEEPDGTPAISIDETIRNAVSQLSDLEGLLKAVVLVLDSPALVKPASDVVSSDDTLEGADAPATVSSLNALLALNNVILYTVYAQSVHSASLEQLTEQSGGKNIYLSNRVPLIDALRTAYDSILLRTIQLAPQTALYESDTICEPPASEPSPESASEPAPPAKSRLLEIILLAVLLGGIGVIVGYLIFIARLMRGRQETPPLKAQSSTDKSDQSPASFSTLTIGMNRVRNTFSEMETRLNALSGDLDNYGSDNWELQKKIISAYAEISRELFLLYDHLCIHDGETRNEETGRLKRKIEQAMENNAIGEIVPEVGERFHSKYHKHAGERTSEQKPGTILEVVRNGYQRDGFIGDEPFVLRQAEVIVSAGNEQEK